jgi:hypothetical protein
MSEIGGETLVPIKHGEINYTLGNKLGENLQRKIHYPK